MHVSAPTVRDSLAAEARRARAARPSRSAQVSLAAVVAHTHGALAGLAELNALGEPAFQPWWAVRAHLLAELGRRDDAARVYAKAISLKTDPAVRGYLGSI